MTEGGNGRGAPHAPTWKMELHALPSLTLTDRQFLTGDAAGASVTLTAALRLPTPMGTCPAVILLHGSGGVSGYVDDWSRFLNGLGVATLLVDSFTGRGIDTTLANQSQLGRLAMIIDAYRAFDVIAQHPRIDSQRVALMGFSRGGQASLYAAVERFQRMHGPKHGDFAAYVSFYPACHTRFIDDERVSTRPIHVLHGDADSFNAIEPCRDYVHRVQRAGGNISLHEFAGADHVFDWPMLTRPLLLQGARSNRGVLFEERERGVIVARDTGEPAEDAEARFKLNPTLFYDAPAFHEARRIVADLVMNALLR